MAFFIAYAIFEIPSNVLLERFGARRWFARIMLTWGLVTVLTALVTTSWQFYLARFLLGVAEAGFYPGVLYFMTKWYPYRYRARMVGWFMMASPLAFIIGNPIMGALDDLDGTLGLEGWQWIFIATGLPAVLLTFVTLRVLPDGPADARWLDQQGRDWIEGELAAERQTLGSDNHGSPLRALRDKRVVLMSLYFLCFPLGAVGLAASAMVDNHVLQIALISVAALGIFSGQPVLWSLPSRFLTGVQAAAGIAMINAIGNLGGGFGPMGIGVIVDRTGSPTSGLWFLVGALVIATVATFGIRRLIENGRVVDTAAAEPEKATAAARG